MHLIAITDGSGNPIFYNTLSDIFAGRDARLYGTVILPGSAFKGRNVDIWAGYQLADGSIVTGDDRGAQNITPVNRAPTQVVGFDGPVNAKEFTAQSGFYLRKYVDPTPAPDHAAPIVKYLYSLSRMLKCRCNAAEAGF